MFRVDGGREGCVVCRSNVVTFCLRVSIVVKYVGGSLYQRITTYQPIDLICDTRGIARDLLPSTRLFILLLNLYVGTNWK